MRRDLFVIAVLFVAACAGAPRYPVSDHFDGDRFFNPGVVNDKKFSDLLKWVTHRQKREWPLSVANVGHPGVPRFVEKTGLRATWIGHATVLVQLDGANILTDPIFSERASPVSFAGPRRVRPPGLTYDELPVIQAVVISHNHYDHLDLPSLVELERRFAPMFIVPLGNGALLRGEGLTHVTELDWWQSVELPGGHGLNVTLTPALHWGRRGLADGFEALWGSYFIRNGAGRSVYFAGDTGYHTHFRETFDRLGAPDLALLPIGAYEPRWFMKDNHMNPEEAVRAHMDLHAAHSIPMHYATFQLTDEGLDEPLSELSLAKARLMPAAAFEPLEVGASWLRPDEAAADLKE